MSVRVFGPDGKEVDLKAYKKLPRKLHPFEDGFHKAVIGSSLKDNPFPLHTSAAEEWDSGWKTFKERKQKYDWMPKGQLPNGSDFTFLCLVRDREGFFLHKPCKPKYVGFDLRLVWMDYQNQPISDIVEFAIVPMRNPQFVNAMQANTNWKPVNSDDVTAI